MSPKFTKFHDEWFKMPEFKDWVSQDSSSNTIAKCKVCMVSFDLSNMGKNALISHQKSKKHQIRMKNLTSNNPIHSWLKPVEPPVSYLDETLFL